MAKDVLAGKEIKETKVLGNGLTMLIFTDGTFSVVSQLSDNLDFEELGIEAGESSDDDDDEEESEEEEDEDDDSDEDEDDEDEDEDNDEEEEDEDDEEEGEEITAEDLLAMDFDDLEDLVDDEELDIDVDDFDEDEDKLRKAVAKAMGIKLPAAKEKKGKKK